MERLTKENIKDMDMVAVIVTDIENNQDKGWFIVRGNNYYLLPFNSIWRRRLYKWSHIKTIKYLSNGVEFKRTLHTGE